MLNPLAEQLAELGQHVAAPPLPLLYEELCDKFARGDHRAIALVLQNMAAQPELAAVVRFPLTRQHRWYLGGGADKPVVRMIDLPAGTLIPPHPHGGHSGVDSVLFGRLSVTDWHTQPRGKGYQLTVLRQHALGPGDYTYIDDRVQVHSLFAVQSSRLLMAAAVDLHTTAEFYPENGWYHRRWISLPDDRLLEEQIKPSAQNPRQRVRLF